MLLSLIAAALVGTSTAPVTNVVEALSAPSGWYQAKRPFSLVGHVVRMNDTTRNGTFWSCPHALSIYLPPHHPHISDNDLVRVTGHFGSVRGGYHRQIVDDVQTIRRGVRPEPARLTAAQAADVRLGHSYVRVQGVLVKARQDAVDPRFVYLVLRDPTGVLTGVVPASFWANANADRLLDAEIALEGIMNEAVGWRKGLAPTLLVSDHAPIDVVKAAPASIRDCPPLSKRSSIHRQKTSGVVLAAANGRLFIRPDADRTSVMEVRPCRGALPPPVDARVTVAGFARLDPFHTMLDEALVEPAPPRRGQGAAAPPRAIRTRDLVVRTSEGERIDTKLHGRLVSCQGMVRRMQDGPDDATFSLVDGEHRINVDLGGIPSGRRIPPEDGATVRATGLLLAEFENPDAYAALPAFRRFTLIPRSPDEIVVLKQPAWWTPARLLTVIVILVVVLIAFIIWNRSLRTLSERRGRELFRARFARAKSDLKVEERTRLAVELHDALSQTLTGVALQIETAKGLMGDDAGPVRRLLATAGQMLASCRGELQACIWDLRSRTFDEKDMTEAVTRTVDTHVGSARLSVRFNAPRRLLSETTTHAILRIVRECAVNAVRHGHATEIRIAGNFEDGVIRFSVTDNGCGFVPEQAPGPREGHFGLQGVRERLRAFGGTIDVNSKPGAGTRIKITMKPDEEP